MAKKEAPTIKTKRLTLRRLTEEDIPNMSKMFGNNDVTKYLTGDTPPSDEHTMLKIVRLRKETEWAIILNETNEFIGDCMIPNITENYLCEIGCVLMQEHWGKGYAKESMLAIIDYCTNALKIKRLCAKMDNKNIRAKKLIESLSFEQNAVLPEANFIGRICDIAYYSKRIN
jgi:[ribosomal protein S5]-alanine N-acetyltransferase